MRRPGPWTARAQRWRRRSPGRVRAADQGRRGTQPGAGRRGPGAGERRTAQPLIRAGACLPRSRGCGGCRNTSTPAAAASGPKPGPGSPRRNGNSRLHTTRKSTKPDRGDRPRQRGIDAGRSVRSRWPMPTCSRRSAPTPAAEATTPARCWAESSSATCSAAACGVDWGAGAPPHSVVSSSGGSSGGGFMGGGGRF